jgi:hypothetical protein
VDICPNCRSRDVVGFALAPAGQPLRFSHCRGCEHRWWTETEGGSTVRLPDVLDHMRPARA